MKVPVDAMGTTRRCVRCGESIQVTTQNATAVPQAGKEGGERFLNRTGRGDTKRLIGEMLVDEHVITRAQLDAALHVQKEKGGKLVETLIALEYLETREFLRFLSRQPGVASIDLLNYTIPVDVISLIPPEFALKHEILPIDKLGRDLTVGMACPLDSKTIKDLEEITGLRVRPLLVSMNDIRVALNRYFGERPKQTMELAGLQKQTPGGTQNAPDTVMSQVESAITFEGIAHIVREIKSLPALPETISEIRAAMEDPATDGNHIAQILERDPSLSAKVISLANSSAYGFSHRVSTVELAVSLLGLREIYSVVLASAVVDYFEESTAFDYKKYWKRSMFCGTAAKIIGRTCGLKNVSALFAAGLIHDLGKLVLSDIAPGRYAEVDQNLKDHEIMALENDLFGVAHPEVGYILAESWSLPDDLAQSIRWHADIKAADACQETVAAVGLSALMADAYGKITKDNVGALVRDCKVAMDLLKMNDQQFIQVLGETAQAIRQEHAD
jgi:HD-like signal output (HDOD) protein